MIEDRNYLFVCGCARSGTSVLSRLLNSHKLIVMGTERYGKLMGHSNFQLKKEHFYPERFLDIRPNDTHNIHPKLGANYDKKVYSEDVKYIGDKRPSLYRVYDQLFDEFPTARVLFIFRDAESVMHSWQDRLENSANWPKSRGYRRALFEWKLSIQLTLEALKKYPGKIALINYNHFFKEFNNFSLITDWLEISIDDDFRARISDIKKKSPPIKEVPAYILDFVKRQGDPELFKLANELSLTKLN